MPGGVQWDLFSPDWVVAAAASEGDEDPDAPAVGDELDEVLGELQQTLAFGERRKYAVPELEGVATLPVDDDVRIYVEHSDACAHVREMDSAELAQRLDWLHRHRGRGLSELDQAVQREWTARALGVGYFYGRTTDPALPPQLVELAGRRAPTRRLVLAALCTAMLRRANGICISAPEAFMLWGVPASTWWHVIAWLEERGLLVRLRRWKNNASDRHTDAPVQLVANWYGPGPELVAMRDAVLAAYGDSEVDDAVRAEARRLLLETRRERRRQKRRAARDVFELELDAPGWLIAVGHAAYAATVGELAAERDLERAREIRSGSRSWRDVAEDELEQAPVIRLEDELGRELERLAVAGVELSSAELEQRARLAELEALDAALEHEAPPCSSPASGRSGGAARAERGGAPAGPAGPLRGSTITVQSMDGVPLGRGEDRKEAPRKGPAGPAGAPPRSARAAPPERPDAGEEHSAAGSGRGARYGPAPAEVVAETRAAVAAIRRRAELAHEARTRDAMRSAAEALGIELELELEDGRREQ